MQLDRFTLLWSNCSNRNVFGDCLRWLYDKSGGLRSVGRFFRLASQLHRRLLKLGSSGVSRHIRQQLNASGVGLIPRYVVMGLHFLYFTCFIFMYIVAICVFGLIFCFKSFACMKL